MLCCVNNTCVRFLLFAAKLASLRWFGGFFFVWLWVLRQALAISVCWYVGLFFGCLGAVALWAMSLSKGINGE
jgi:hypothetical protein